jgi:sulfane dehydrogenase subunit SoxC
MSAKKSDRRQFLRNSAAFAAFAAGAAAVRSVRAQDLDSEKGHATDTPEAQQKALDGTPGLAPGQHFDAIYGVRSRYENAGRIGGIGAYITAANGKSVRPFIGGLTPIQDLIGSITPAALHYFNNHGYLPPDIDPSEHRLLIHGMVDRPMELSMEDIYRLPQVTRAHFLECNANGYTANPARRAPEATAQVTHGLTSCSIWTGVQASHLMELVGAQKKGTWIVAEGAEGAHHSKSIPMWKVMDDALIVYGQNGEALRPEQGYPLRILLPGFEAINSIKYLRRIKVVDTPYLQERETSGYQTVMNAGKYADGKARWFQFEMGPKSVITRPSGTMQIANLGYYEITGLAWSGAGAVKRVEISTDNGKTWKDAELQGPVLPKAHTRFTMPWKWAGQETILLSRTTDDRGQVQPSIEGLGKLWGVDASYFQKSQVGHTNAIQPWRVAADGKVYNAIFA